MYNLFVSSNSEAWNGEPWQQERGRCVREYTTDEVQAKFGALGQGEIEQLRRFPCIFAYEAYNDIAPRFGLINNVTVRQDGVRVDYQLDNLRFELEIGKWELNRTHWSVKDVDLPAELNRHGIQLPRWAARAGPRINLAEHRFDVALSFPGEARDFVENVAKNLERLLGPDKYFYDRNYTAQLARPSLDTFLQAIYRDRSKLIVVFVGGDYQLKDWCGIEFRAIREIINKREHDRVMYVRMDDGEVEGVFAHDGYVDTRHHDPIGVAELIAERLDVP